MNRIVIRREAHMRMRLIHEVGALLLILTFAGCQPRINLEAEKAEILSLNETVRRAHFEHDAAKFLSSYADQWYSVSGGNVVTRRKSEAIPGLDQYLKNTEFVEVADNTPPRIEISDNGTMAWLIGDVRVRALTRKPDGQNESLAFVSAWLAVYEKRDSKWQLVATSSSERKE